MTHCHHEPLLTDTGEIYEPFSPPKAPDPFVNITAGVRECETDHPEVLRYRDDRKAWKAMSDSSLIGVCRLCGAVVMFGRDADVRPATGRAFSGTRFDRMTDHEREQQRLLLVAADGHRDKLAAVLGLRSVAEIVGECTDLRIKLDNAERQRDELASQIRERRDEMVKTDNRQARLLQLAKIVAEALDKADEPDPFRGPAGA